MKKQNRALYVSLVSVILVGALVLIYVLTSGIFYRKEAGIVLSGAQAEPVFSSVEMEENRKLLHSIDVTTENIQDVVQMLRRPAAYQYALENELHFKGGSAATQLRYAERGGVSRIETLDAQGNAAQVEICKGDATYVWAPGDSSYYKGKRGAFQAEGASALPHYMDITASDAEILSVTQRTDEEPLVLVEFMKNGYRCVYTISVINGLLTQADFYSGDVLARHVTMQEVSTDMPSAALFALPNGTSLLGE